MIRRLLIPVAVVTLSLALAGCGGGSGADSGDGGGAASTPATDTSTDAGTDTPAPGDTTAPTTPAGATAPACTRDQLIISYSPGDSTAGQMHGTLTFTAAGVTCSLSGFPIAYMGNPEVEGPVGAASKNQAGTPVGFDLAPGSAATAPLTITQAANVGGCTVAQTTHLIVAPPLDHDFEWTADGRDVTIASTNTCTGDTIGLLTVGVLTPVE